MNVLIFYEHRAREFETAIRMRKMFKSRQVNAYVASFIFERSIAWVNALRWKPDVIMMPWVVGEDNLRSLYAFVKLNPHVIIVDLHQEQITCKAMERVLLPYTEYAKNGCYHYVWGEYFKKQLINSGVEENKIFVTGSTRNDLHLGSGKKKEILSERYGLDLNKKWILFAENRGWLTQNNYLPTMHEDLNKRGYNDEQIEFSIQYEKNSLKAFQEDLKTAVEKGITEKYEFIYRPHPGTRSVINVPKEIRVIAEMSIYDWIKSCDLFLTCESTSIFEAELCEKACATVDYITKPDELKMQGVEKYTHIDHISDINDQLIIDLMQKQKKQDKPIYEEFLGHVDGEATRKVVEITIDLYKHNILSMTYPNAKSTWKENSIHFFFEITSYFFAKTGLLEKLKFPRTAYRAKTDLPYLYENK